MENNKLATLITDIIGENCFLNPEENLFSIGLDSIKIMNLVSILRKEGYDVTFPQFIKNPTIVHWMQLLELNKNKIKNNFYNYNKNIDKFPLAPIQHSYWIGSMSNQELGGVSAHIYVEFDGYNVDPVILEQSINELVNRHEMLRVNILDDGNQRILPKIENKIFNLIDLREFSESIVKEKLEEIRQQKSNQNIQKNNQVIDITLSLLPNLNNRLHIDVDMIAIDAMSYRILLKELAIIYDNNSVNVLPKINYSYKDYILYKINSKSQKYYDEDKSWWNDKLDSFPNPPQLPLKTNFNQNIPCKAKRLHYWISDKEKLNIQNNCKHYKVTMAMALVSAFAHAIGTHCKESKFFLNLPLFNREKINDQIDNIVGDFSSSILLNVDLSNDLSIINQINAISNSFIDNISHSNYSALEVLRDLGKRKKTLFLAPIVYTSAINLGEIFDDKLKENFGKPVWIVSQGPQVILDAQITEFDGGLLANWDIRDGLFLPGVVETMFEIYKQNIRKLSYHHNNWSEKFDLYAIEKQILYRNKFNNIPFETSRKLLHQLFFENAQLNPDKIALRWKLENKVQKQYTYFQLSQLAINFANFLYNNNVRSNNIVALSLPKGHKQIIAILGILYLGATYLPISLKYPYLRKKRILEIAKANFYIINVEDDIICNVDTKFLIFDENIFNVKSKNILNLSYFNNFNNNSIAYIIFTSGTTGDPKGVAVSHKAVMNTLESVNSIFAVNDKDISLAFSELEFDLSIQDIFGMFNIGASAVLLDDKNRYDADYWVELINEYKITQVYAVPSMLDMLLSAKPSISLPSLKLVILGGDKISFKLYNNLKKRAHQCRFASLGGATEVAIHCTYFEVKKFDENLDPVPYGYPLFNTSCKVVNTNFTECPNWVVGELLVSGAGLADGYINDPSKTLEKFFEYQGAIWYRTGDLVRYSDKGVIEYISRTDNQVKIRGYRVELSEIERLLNKVRGIKNSVVFVNRKKGINLVAYVEVEDLSKNLNQELLKKELSKYLPSYMIPENIIILYQFPVTSNAKIDRKKLQDQFFIENTNTSSNLSMPNTALEKFIAMQYTKFTGANNVYLEDDFFSLGGDSVLATKLISSVREDLNFQGIAIADIFDYRSVKLFVDRLKQLEIEEGIFEKTAQILLEIELLSDDELLKLDY